jgi:hypothetical protein
MFRDERESAAMNSPISSIRRLGAVAFLALVFSVMDAHAQMSGGEPTNAVETAAKAEAAVKKAAAEKLVDERYQKLKAAMSPEQQRWETTLEQNLGSYYLPLYKRDFVNGLKSAWDYVPDEPALPRVLLIGDSISRGYTLPARALLQGRVNLHRAPANCGSTKLGVEKLDVWLGAGRWDLIHFNFGIHDRETPENEYVQRLETIVERLKATGAKLVWASTTPVPAESIYGCDETIVRLNWIAAGIMGRHQIPIDDLYTFARPRLADFQNKNDVHFSLAGYDFLGAQVAREIEAALSLPRR